MLCVEKSKRKDAKATLKNSISNDIYIFKNHTKIFLNEKIKKRNEGKGKKLFYEWYGYV